MTHWVDTYPHTIYASVLLRDNKIINWKIGQRKWLDHMDMTRRMKLPYTKSDYDGETVESKVWEVNDDHEHSQVFEVLAKEWFKNWDIHEKHEGSPAHNGRPNYFDIARLLLPHSNCLKRHYACVIVKDGRVISKGWNQSLTGCTTCHRDGIPHNTGDYSECSSVHAEAMALLNANTPDAELYLVCDKEENPTPCPACQKMLNWCGVTQRREPQ